MNKHSLVLYAYLLLTCITANAQSGQKIYDQFKRETKNLKEDTNKVLLSLAFAKKLNTYSQDTVLLITKKAKELAYKLNYQRGIELSIHQEGISAEIEKDYPLAIRHYGEAAKIAEQHKFNDDIYAEYNSSLNIYYYLADYPNAMKLAQKGLSLAEQLNDKESQAYYNNQIGYVYLKQEKADESIKYSTKYLVLANEVQNNMMTADAYNEIGDGFMLKKDYKGSLLYFSKALNIYNKMTAMERLDNTQMIFKSERIAYTLFKISSAYKQEGDYKQALRYSTAVFDNYKKNPNTFNSYDLANYYINAGDIYRALKNYRQAGILLNKGLSTAISILHREDMRDAYAGLSKNFAYQNRYDSAYYYHILFTRLKDSIINEKVNKEINKLEIERSDKEIALLNQQRKLKETETARQNLTRNFIIGFATLIAVISFLLLYIKSNNRHQKLVFEKQLAIQAERQRISSDMHDDIGTGLSTMLIYINMLKIKLADSDDGTNIDRISVLGTELVDQMKEIVWSLSPGNDKLDSLLLFLRQYFVMLFEPLPYQINIDLPLTIPDIKIDSDMRRNIFLCVKESLNNVIKHARATQVDLQVQIMHNTLIIRVKDNGKGLTMPASGSGTGNGLKNIYQRMNAMKGKFNILNANGTIVRLELDLPTYPNR
jgi:two-component system NarL family sensor kinase